MKFSGDCYHLETESSPTWSTSLSGSRRRYSTSWQWHTSAWANSTKRGGISRYPWTCQLKIASQCYLRALLSTFGPNIHSGALTLPPPLVDSDYYVSGNIRLTQGDLQDALRLQNIALTIRQKVLGTHIQTAASCYRVGDLLDRTGDRDAAL